MPMYDYYCASCHVTRPDVIVRKPEQKVKCSCGQVMSRLLSSANFTIK